MLLNLINYHMKKWHFLFLQIFFFLNVSAQDSIEAKASKIITYLERNIQASDAKEIGKPSDFFIYDISLGNLGEISSINILLMDSLTCILQIRQIASYIKSNYIFPVSKVKKIFIPVLIVHSGNDEEPSASDKALMETVGFFENPSMKTTGTVYITRRASIIRIAD